MHTNRATQTEQHKQSNKTEQQNAHYQFSAFYCSVCFVIVCLPEEDPSGSKRCNGCFDLKVLCAFEVCFNFAHKFIKPVQTSVGEFGCLEV